MENHDTENNARVTESNARVTENNACVTESNACVTESNARITESDAHLYKMIIEDSLMVPFRILGFFNSNDCIPILPRFVIVNVSDEIDSLNMFTATLTYGITNWEVKRMVFKLRHLCRTLREEGIIIESFDSMKSIFNVNSEILERIIGEILTKSRNLYDPELFAFFNITRFSFVGEKGFEEHLYMCYSDYSVNSICISCCSYPKSVPYKIYVICKKTHILLYDYRERDAITHIVYFRSNFTYEVVQGPLYHDIRFLLFDQIIILSSVHSYNMKMIKNHIDKSMEIYKDNVIRTSFAPLRSGNIINFYVDAQGYYSALYNTLMGAKKEIFIAGWWVYPKLFLRRERKGKSFDKSYRLDNILKEKARQGVKIYIIIYQEFYLSLPINSSYTYDVLSKLHNNIQIIKYPNETPTNLTYWSLHDKIVIIDQRISYLGGMDLCLGRFDDSKHNLFDTGSVKKKSSCCRKDNLNSQCEGYRWPGQDYSNPVVKDFKDVECYKKSCVDRHHTPRMPWHDVHCSIVGPSAFDINLHFIQRWNFLSRKVNNLDIEQIIPDETFLISSDSSQDFHVSCQILRSSTYWSQNIPTESSIHEAYKKLINNSEKFIYIENQSFITNNDCPQDYQIQNTIGFSIIKRIERAYMFNERFKVYIVIPLLPAFEAANTFNESSTMNTLLELQSKTIYNGRCSFIDILKAKGIDYEEYIVFLSLYKTQIYNGNLKGEQIYVHSKIMICDGTKMIIGSANINDRSMLGDRDSEICAYVEDINGKEVENLLEYLLKEHFCYKEVKKSIKIRKLKKKVKKNSLRRELINLFKKKIDLSHTETFNLIQSIAKRNSKITNKLFKDIPNNKMKTFEDVNKQKNVKRDVVNESLASRLIGRFILYPFKFLCNEERDGSTISLQSLVPHSVYH